MNRISKKGWMVLALAAIGVSTYVVACSGEIYDSVHYNEARPDFGAAPSPTVITTWGETPSRPVPEGSYGTYEEYDEAKEKAKEQRIANLRGQAERSIQSEQYSTAKSALENLLKEDIEDKEIIRDQLEVLQVNEKERLPAAKLIAYFKVRKTPNSVPALQAIAKDESNGFLKAYAEYGIAADAYDQGEYPIAAKQYERVAKEFPGSMRKEPALMMVVRTRLKGQESEDGKVRILPADVAAGQKAIQTLRADFPKSRFIPSANGWETRALYLEGKHADAFLRYLQVFQDAKGYDEKTLALSSLEQVRKVMKASEADKVRAGLIAKPTLLEPYLDYRLYHGGEELKKDLSGLATLAKQILEKKPGINLSAGIHARLAEIAYLDGKYDDSGSFARDSLETKADSKPEARRDLATYILASSLNKQRVLREAVTTYEKVISDYPNSYLVGSARENLALLHEGFGDWGKALDQYRALKYNFDVATLVDVRMSTDELAAYVKDHAGDKEIDTYKYSLGMRLLRKEKLDEAEAWFKQISAAKLKEVGQIGSRNYSWNAEENSDIDKLVDPLTTIADLRGLKTKATSATTPEAKAAAQYALASYWYEKRNLLLYNPAMWSGARSVLSSFWDAGVDKAGYEKAILEHHYEHECLWRARKISVLLAKEYPNTPSAPKALYRAACAARRLADFNTYWRDEKLAKPLWNESITLLEQIVAKYPNDPLAKNAAKYSKVFKKERDDTYRKSLFAEMDSVGR